MAKKIRLDFSKTEERSGWNTKHIAEGLHKMKIASVEETEAQDGTAMLVYALVPDDARYKTRRFPFYCKLQQNQLWKLRDLIVAAGGTVPKKAVSIDPNAIVGKYIAAEVEDDTYQGNVRSQVQGTYGLDVLDEDGSAGDAGDADEDEEYEGDEDEADEAEDEDAEDEEEEEEGDDVDLDDMTLPELRALAKEYGIKTVKKSKDDLIAELTEALGGDDEDEEGDDEDDLGDEDLEDEAEDEEYEDDEEEEEEEPEPAPRRRAAAKKAPAKAAPAKAAPAKRTVRRR